MVEYKKLFDRDLVLLDVNAKNREDLFKQVANQLFKKGYVKKNYFEELNKREDEFPTGVVTEYLSIALPHANPENVLKPFIAVIQTKLGIHVEQMGIGEDEITNNFFFLGIVKETQALQVKLLQRFMELMNDQSFVDEYREIDNSEQLYNFLIKKF